MASASLPFPCGGVSNLGSICRNRQILAVPILGDRRGERRRYPRLRHETGRRFRVSSSSGGAEKDSGSSSTTSKKAFGYSRKDVLLIGVGVTALGFGLKSGLEYVGVEEVEAGNAVQLIMVLGLTLGWISTYIFRVSNKEMTYAQQLRDYEDKVIQKRLDSLSDAELEALLEEVDEEKLRSDNLSSSSS